MYKRQDVHTAVGHVEVPRLAAADIAVELERTVLRQNCLLYTSTLYRIQDIIDGDLDEIIDALRAEELVERLREMK